MPRNFLVKRNEKPSAASYRARHHSEESDSGSDLDHDFRLFCSPGSTDSGYAPSPVSLSSQETRLWNNFLERRSSPSLGSTAGNSPCVLPHANYSPLYISALDRLTVSSANISPSRAGNLVNTLNPKKRQASAGKETESKSKIMKKPKAARKLNFDIDTTSPVSGTIIRELPANGVPDETGRVVSGDIDSSLNFVEVTPEAKAEIAKIENKIGDYICQLCKDFFDDAFKLAQHRCSRIVHIEYRCPECDKCFNCPANLASHRRWHKPRPNAPSFKSAPAKILPAEPRPRNPTVDRLNNNITPVPSHKVPDQPELLDLRINKNKTDENNIRKSPSFEDEGQFECNVCMKKFRRQAYLRKHMFTHDSQERPHPCRYCGKVLSNEASLARHLLQHNDTMAKEIDHECSLCGEGFPDRKSLDAHARTQHSQDVYSCKYCPSAFFSSPGLTRHINKCHPTESRQVILLNLPHNYHRNSDN